ncbi:restriction endonuclease subunit S [Thiolinea disciformis]|uniref:restriction endonuclease subunit S n=1 Tax=Thiolinea disciformis TaxID=125614 RepID=UPI00037E33C5|nr:restriction endonuclease subunit S [Thiolinea disciformis]
MSNWNYKPLGEVCDVIGGGTPSKENPIFYTGDIPWATVRDMKSDILSQTEFCITGEAVRASPTNIIKANNVIIATRVGLGKVCLLNQDTAINQDLRGIIPKSLDFLIVPFLYWWLKSIAPQIIEAGTGATVQGVKLPFIKSLPIPLPSPKEQKRIVAILDEAFVGINQAIANTEKNLANARELFDSYLESTSHNKKPLGNFVNIKTGKLDANAAVVNGIYPFFTCSREIYQIDNFAFDCEAVLLAGNNASGDFNVKHFRGKFNAYQRTYVITIKNEKELLYRFLYYQLIKSLKELKNKSVGAGTKFLKLGMIQNLEIDIPPITLQQNILDKLENLSIGTANLITIYQQKLQALAELKQSLLQKAFSGELTANNVDKLVNP